MILGKYCSPFRCKCIEGNEDWKICGLSYEEGMPELEIAEVEEELAMAEAEEELAQETEIKYLMMEIEEE